MSNKKYTVDIIIPIRSREEYDVLERLKWRNNYNLPDNFQFIIVDYGSPISEHKIFESFCEQSSYKYIYVEEAVNKLWNASKARNIALLNSDADYVFFEDLDLLSHKDFYQWINSQVEVLIASSEWPFFVVPVSYLTEDGSSAIHSPLKDDEYNRFTTEIYKAKSSNIINFHVPTSSYLLCSRKHALEVGGYDEAFEGWGFEDSDFWLRLLRSVNIDKPRDFYRLDTREYSNQVQWRGWRALFRVFGDLLAFKGIYSFHIWHPIAEHRNDNIKKKNHNIFLSNSSYYQNERFSLTPLWDSKKKTHLFLSRNPHSFNRYLFEKFDNPYLVEEKNIDVKNIDELIKELNIDSVIFNNPYGNVKRKVIYDAFKNKGIKCYVVERGALPWSIYIDEGFCAESISYSEENWPKNLSETYKERTIQYIEHLKTSGASLEPQAELIGGANLKRKVLGNGNQVKILFIALQSPSDTTTNFFCGQIGTYDKFISEIQKLPYLLDDNWKIIYKNHPLTIDKVKIEGAINVDDYHIGDILDASDSVALINSGVGVLAAAYKKPVFYFGQAFYACPGINMAVDSADSLKNGLKELTTSNFDDNKSLQFISYLINDFYSFAGWDRKERKHTDKANLSISENIQYKVVRIPALKFKKYFEEKAIDLKESLLFDRYRLDEYIERTKPKVKPTAGKVSAPKTNNVKAEPDLDRKKDIELYNKKNKGTFSAKMKKLVRSPKLFFTDFFIKRL